jgi:hypothetical protein
MITLSTVVSYLMMVAGAAVVVLVGLVVYGNVLDNNEDEELYLNPREERIMAGDQPALIRRMNSLSRVITVVAFVAGVTLLAGAGIWVYIGLFRS